MGVGLSLDFVNINLAEQPVPIRPGMHYQMGGIKTDVNGSTVVPGLYAAGECACAVSYTHLTLPTNSRV